MPETPIPPRFSLRMLLAVGAAVFAALGAFRSATPALAAMVFSATALGLVAATLAARYRSEAVRPFWFGFALAGWLYFGVAFLPGLKTEVAPKLMTQDVLRETYAALRTFEAGSEVEIEWHGGWYSGSILALGPEGYRIHYDGHGPEWDEWVSSARLRPIGPPEAALTLGHALLALAAGLLGAFIAAWIASRRSPHPAPPPLTELQSRQDPPSGR